MSVAKRPRFWAIAIALSFFVINFAQIGRYGLSYDEPAGMERARETIALVAGLVGLPGAEDAHYVPGWLHNHPSFYVTCNYGISRVLIQRFGWQPIPAGHFLNLLMASGGLVVIFHLGKLLFNPTVGLVAEIFTVFFPRFISQAHFNAKDLPMMEFATLAILLLTVAARGGRARCWILAGFGVALAVVTKLDGLFVLPIFLIPWLIRSLRPDNRLSNLRKVAWFIGATVLFIYLLWPELWLDPLHLFRSVSNFATVFRTTQVPYLGHNYPMAHLPWHYNLVEFMADTPLVLLVTASVGAAWSLRSLRQGQNAFEHGLLWCWILIPVLPRMLPGVVRYEGMRHVFLIVPAVALMAGIGVDQLLSRWKNRRGYKLAPVLCGGAIVWSGYQLVECHPCEGFYVNEAVRAVVPGPKLPDYFDMYGWGTVTTQGVEWINGHAPPGATVWIGSDVWMLRSYGLRNDLKGVAEIDKADYVVVGCTSGDLIKRFTSAPVYSLPCYGLNLVCVFAQRAQ